MARFLSAFFLAVLVAAGPAEARAGAGFGAQTATGQKPKKAKKVWTNDDLEQLRGTAPVSVPGGAGTPEGTAAKGAGEEAAGGEEKGPYVKEKDPKWYAQRMASLRDELDRTDKEISRLRNFLQNPSSGQAGMALGQENARLSPANQIDQLQRQREKISRQMSDLETEARRNGISPGALR